jgi:hypothetical protein
MHISAALADPANYARNKTFEDEVLHAVSLFAPEFFALAALAKERRGLTYRLPDRLSMSQHDNGWHHGFVQVRRAIPNKFVHIEWRLFEAAYDNWQYVERAAYVAAGLTRALLHDSVFSTLMGTGYGHPFSDAALQNAVRANDVDKVLMQVNFNRMNALREVILQHLDDDTYASEQVAAVFAQAGSL